MARINVEQRALSDSRFRCLGTLLGASPELAQATGLGVMLGVWNEAQEREVFTFTALELDAITGCHLFGTHAVHAGLMERTRGRKFRVKGADGRLEWLGKKRRIGRLNGKLGGRPKRTNEGTKQEPTENQHRFRELTPPAPALKAGETTRLPIRKPAFDPGKPTV
jgi:hypothetical protein